MRLKKSVFGYVNFTIGTVIMSVYLYTLFVSLLRNLEENAGRRVYFYGVSVPYLLGAALVLACVGLFFLVSLLKSKIPVRQSDKEPLATKVIYWFFLALLFSYGLFLRISHIKVIKEWGTIKSYTENASNPGYWKNLLNLFFGNEVSFDNFFHKLYSYVAALLLRIFGDTLTVPTVLNIVLYMLASIMILMSVKYIFGRVPALFVFAALMASQTTVGLVYEIAGFNLFLVTLALIIFLVTYFLDVYTGSKPVMCYIIATLTLVGVVIFNHFVYKPFSFKSLFRVNIFAITPERIGFYPLICIMVIGILALFAYLSFIKNKEDELSFANIVFIVLLVIHIFDNSTNNTFWFMIISLCVLAGIGTNNLLFKHYKEVAAIDVPEETPEVIFVEAPVETTVEIPAETGADSFIEDADKPIDKPEEKAPEVKEEKPAEKPQVPRFFETPLPMPKRHVKKSIDYAFEPGEDLMKYDVEISADDDFDIK